MNSKLTVKEAIMYLAPLNYDRFFKKIFKDEKIAKAFLEDFLDVEIEEIKKLDEKHRITDKSKVVEFDYRCKIDGKYIIIDMQQWYKPDVSQRFYIYHALNSALQLEELKSKAISLNFENKKNKEDESLKVKEIKDYRLIEPVLTLIWMVSDSLGFKNDFVSYKLLPETISTFIENNEIWYDENFKNILKERENLLKMVNNDKKDIDFLQKNKLIFMFQKNIIKNMETVRKVLKKTPSNEIKTDIKYRKWFDFAYKTLNKENSKADFIKYENDSLFKDIIKRLDQSELSEDDLQYIVDYSNMQEKFNRYDAGVLAEGMKQGIKQGIKQGEKKKAIEIAKNLLDILDNEIISKKTNLSIKEIEKLRRDFIIK